MHKNVLILLKLLNAALFRQINNGFRKVEKVREAEIARDKVEEEW